MGSTIWGMEVTLEKISLQWDVFLGGTCGGNRWRRERFVPGMAERGIGAERLFDPVVADWTPACQEAEDAAKAGARFLLSYIGDPRSPGNEVSAYSLVESVTALYDEPGRTVVVFDLAAYPPTRRKPWTSAAATSGRAFLARSSPTPCRLPWTGYRTLDIRNHMANWLLAVIRFPGSAQSRNGTMMSGTSIHQRENMRGRLVWIVTSRYPDLPSPLTIRIPPPSAENIMWATTGARPSGSA